MRIDLDDNYTIVSGKWGQPNLIKHKKDADVDKKGNPVGYTLYFQTFGQAVKSYIKQSAGDADIKSFEQLAQFIDASYMRVEREIDQKLKEAGQE